MTISFWIAGNILFDLESGTATQVLQLVTRKEDATQLTADQAYAYFEFVKRHADLLTWYIEDAAQPGRKFIRGEQMQ